MLRKTHIPDDGTWVCVRQQTLGAKTARARKARKARRAPRSRRCLPAIVVGWWRRRSLEVRGSVEASGGSRGSIETGGGIVEAGRVGGLFLLERLWAALYTMSHCSKDVSVKDHARCRQFGWNNLLWPQFRHLTRAQSLGLGQSLLTCPAVPNVSVKDSTSILARDLPWRYEGRGGVYNGLE